MMQVNLGGGATLKSYLGEMIFKYFEYKNESKWLIMGICSIKECKENGLPIAYTYREKNLDCYN